MNLILHLQIKALEHIQYSSELVRQLKSELPESVLFEADNHSDPLIIQQGLQFLKESDKVVLIIESEAGASPSKVAPLIEKVIRHKSINALVLVNGENQLLNKMTTLFRGEVLEYNQLSYPISSIKEFLGD